MATQICALAGVLIHCGFPTSFSESSSRLRASISKRVSLFTNDHRARIFHSTLRHGEPSVSENCSQKKEGGARRVINRGWISVPLKTSHRFIEILVQDPARFVGPTCCRPVTKYFHRVGRHMLRFLAFSSRPRSPKSVNRHRGPRVRAISNRYRAITAAKNERRNTVSVVHSSPPDKSWPACN